jgi:hypothetical protein
MRRWSPSSASPTTSPATSASSSDASRTPCELGDDDRSGGALRARVYPSAPGSQQLQIRVLTWLSLRVSIACRFTQGAAAEIRRAAAPLREAQTVRRRLEKLATLATDAPPSSKRLLDEALVALQGLTDDLARQQRVEQRRLQNALRSGRR